MNKMFLLIFLLICLNVNLYSQDKFNWDPIQMEPEITIAFHPDISGSKDTLKHLFVEELKKITNLNLKVFVPKDQKHLIDELMNEHIDFAFMSAYSYLLSKEKEKLNILLKTIYDGFDSYSTAIVVRSDSKIKSLNDLKGKRFAYIDKYSTSGHLLPLTKFLERKINPELFFKSIIYAGKHKDCFKLLLSKEVDGCPVWGKIDKSGGAWNLYLKAEEQKQVRAIEFFGKIPNEIFTVRTRFYQKYQEETVKIIAALLSYINKPKNRNLIDQIFTIDYFIPTSNSESDFTEIEKMIKTVGPSVKIK